MLYKNQKGVTLIELLITVAIMGILGAIAYPSYTSFVQQSNRAEAQKELLLLANLMEQYFNDNRTYTSQFSKLGKGSDTYITESGNYTMSGSVNTAGTTYTITATVKSGSSQASDSECLTMSVDQAGQKTATNTTCWEK